MKPECVIKFEQQPAFELNNQYLLTKREAFAMAAMQGLLSNSAMIDSVTKSSVDWVVDSSFVIADAHLAALETQP